MRNVRQATVLALAGVLVGAPALAIAGDVHDVHPGETQGLGLRGATTPQILKDIAADPYRAPAEPACETIPAELMRINQVLGADADQPKAKKSRVKQVEKMAAGAVRGMIPYRGEIRFLTQADKRDHQLMDATQAAWARRGFLRGLEANLRCADDTQLDTSGAEPLSAPPEITPARLELPPPAPAPEQAAYATSPGQPWQLPPPPSHDDPAFVAPEPTRLDAVMLRDRDDDEAVERPGR